RTTAAPSAGCSGTRATTTPAPRSGRRRASRPSEAPPGRRADPDRGPPGRLVRRRRAPAERARPRHDPRVPQDRLPRGAVDAHAAVFFRLPAADPPNRLFNQPAYEGRKLQYLASRGYEIGNHTLWHANLGKYDETIVRGQIASAQEWIQRHVPDYKIRALALPHGVYPKDVSWALSGSVKGVTYSHDAILQVSGGPAPSRFSRAWDRVRLPRIQAPEAGPR